MLAVRYDPAAPGRVAIMTDGEQAPSPPGLGPDLSVDPLADRVWLVTAWQEVEGWGRVPANSLVVAGEREVALVDTPWDDEQTVRLLAWVAAHVGLPVTTVIPTHFHDDCLGGLAAAHAAGARSYAFERTAELARVVGNPVPQHLFSGRLTLDLGGRVVEVAHLGGGHTVDAVVVAVPDAAVLFAGDLARSAAATSLGNTADADLGAWPATLAAIEAAYPDARVVVPGHGAPGGRELLAHTRELLAAPPAGD